MERRWGISTIVVAVVMTLWPARTTATPLPVSLCSPQLAHVALFAGHHDAAVGTPTRLSIPAFSLRNRVVEPVNLHRGVLGGPANPWYVGWFVRSARPGETGNAVLVTYYSIPQGPKFWGLLASIDKGQAIIVTDSHKVQRRFLVRGIGYYKHTARVPAHRIYGPTSARHMNIIVCHGAWDASRLDHDEQQVVYTQMAQ